MVDRRLRLPRVLIFASILVATAGVVTLSAVLGWHALPTADDFSVHVRRRAFDAAHEYTKDVYLTWSGRILTTYLIGIVVPLFESLPIVSAGLGVLFCILGRLQFRAFDPGVRTWLGTPLGFSEPWTIVLVTATTGFFALRAHLGQCVFWFTGGIVYLTALVIVVAWLCMMQWGSRWAPLKTPLGLALWSAISALVGTGNEQLWGPALIALAGMFVRVLPGRHPIDRRYYIVGVAGFLLGAVVSLLAPGNFVRAEAADVSVAVTVRRFGITLARLGFEALNYGLVPVVWGAVAALVLAPLYEGRPDRSSLRQERFAAASLVGMAVTSLSPLLLTGRFFSARTFFFFACFSYLSAFILVRSLLTRIAREPTTRAMAAAVGGCLIVLWGHWMTSEIAVARAYRSELAARSAHLRSVAGSPIDLVIPPLANRPPASLHLADVTKDPAHWINRSVARFYRVRSIRLAD